MKKNDEQKPEGKKGFSEKQKQELKKIAVFGLLFVLFSGVIWLIFKPSASELAEENKGIGLNTEIPQPEKVELTQNKKNAYEQEYLKQKQHEKVKALNNFALLAFGDTLNHNDKNNNKDITEERKVSLPSTQHYEKNALPALQHSMDSYKKANEAVSSFYSSSSGDESTEIKKLKAEIEKMKEEMQEKAQNRSRLEEQTELMEKSYQLATKYFPQTTGQRVNSEESHSTSKDVENTHKNKKDVVSVHEIDDNEISFLTQNMSNQEIIKMFSQERSQLYHSEEDLGMNTRKGIQVCIDHDQIITEGQSVCMRLLVPIQVGDVIVPKNTLIAGEAGIRGERLQVTVNTIEYDKRILSVDLTAYALYGQKGIFVPDMMEVNAAKEIAGNMGGNLGTSISLTQSAGQQIASDLGKSLIQGSSQYIQKKVRTVKIHLRSGDPLLLVSNN